MKVPRWLGLLPGSPPPRPDGEPFVLEGTWRGNGVAAPYVLRVATYESGRRISAAPPLASFDNLEAATDALVKRVPVGATGRLCLATEADPTVLELWPPSVSDASRCPRCGGLGGRHAKPCPNRPGAPPEASEPIGGESSHVGGESRPGFPRRHGCRCIHGHCALCGGHGRHHEPGCAADPRMPEAQP